MHREEIGTSCTSTPQQKNLKIEANRLATFENWPNPNISPHSLAKAGFYYLNRSDEVKCAWCQGVIAKWEKEDNAFIEHQRFFPACPRVELGPLIEMASDGIRDLGIQQIAPAKRPKFSSLDARLRSYTNWPITDIQNPEGLAQAGLYYQNIDDQVRCFHCNIGLRSWQKEDDPWFEHARWYPQCQFVRLVKGANYVQHVQDIVKQSAQGEVQTATCYPSMTTDEAMATQPVLQALEIGIDGGSLRNATQRHLLATGRPYDTVEALVKAVFGDPEDKQTSSVYDISNESENAGTSIINGMSRIMSSLFETSNGTNTATNSVSSVTRDLDLICENRMALSESVQRTPIEDNASSVTGSQNVSTSVISTELSVDESSRNPHHEPMLSRTLSLEEENRKLKDARLCKVCLDEEVGVVFLPCGHLVTCVQCAPGISQCPMCRTNIKGFIRTYLS